MKHTKVAIIGVGNVGASAAFALLLSDVISEIILVDACTEKSAGQAKDLNDARAFTQASLVRQGTYADACTADIIVICAGKPQLPGQSREELVQANAQVIHGICAQLTSLSSEAIVIMVTNPLDAMTYLAQQLLPISKNRIFGTGTWLDTQRLRRFLAEHFNVSPQSIEAFMLGEHGDSAVAIVPSYLSLSPQEIERFQQMVIREAYAIIKLKCATYYGIAMCIRDICNAIIHNQRRVLPLSAYQHEFDICISVPVIVGENGIEATVPIALTAREEDLFKRSIGAIQKTLKSL